METAASVQRRTPRQGSQNRGSGPYAPLNSLDRKGSPPGDGSQLAATARRSPRRVTAAKPRAVLVLTTRGRRDTDAAHSPWLPRRPRVVVVTGLVPGEGFEPTTSRASGARGRRFESFR